MKKILIFLLIINFYGSLQAEEDRPSISVESGGFLLTLQNTEDKTLANSSKLQSAEFELKSIQNRIRSQHALFFPKISIEGTYKYLSEIPTLALPVRGANPISFGDHQNYSIGPTVNWTMWDSGAIDSGWKSLKALEESRKKEIELIKKQVILNGRLAYFQVQLNLEQVNLLIDSLKFSWDQYQDIKKRRAAGASSRTDELSAHQEFLSRKSRLIDTQTNFALSLRELFSLTGENQDVDLLFATDEKTNGSDPFFLQSPSVFFKLDPIESSLNHLKWSESDQKDLDRSNVEMFLKLSESFREISKGIKSGHYPKIQLMAKSSMDYPNGPILESVHQNMIGIMATIPIFEGGRVSDQTEEQKNLADSTGKKSEQIKKDLLRDWRKSKDQIAGLKAQREIQREAISEMDEISRIVYDSYKAGRSNYLEVQSANVKLLESKAQAILTDIKIVMQCAVLDYLSK